MSIARHWRLPQSARLRNWRTSAAISKVISRQGKNAVVDTCLVSQSLTPVREVATFEEDGSISLGKRLLIATDNLAQPREQNT